MGDHHKNWVLRNTAQHYTAWHKNERFTDSCSFSLSRTVVLTSAKLLAVSTGASTFFRKSLIVERWLAEIVFCFPSNWLTCTCTDMDVKMNVNINVNLSTNMNIYAFEYKCRYSEWTVESVWGLSQPSVKGIERNTIQRLSWCVSFAHVITKINKTKIAKKLNILVQRKDFDLS